MAENATLKAALREETGKGAARRMRREGKIPAVVYGRGEETRPLTLDAHDFEMLVKEHSLDTTLVELEIEGGGKKKSDTVRTLVVEVQSHPYKPEVLHVDFQQIHAGERVTVEVPVRLVGTPEGVREGGVLQHVMHVIELVCAVESIPESFEIDVSGLTIGDSIHVAELEVPEGIDVLPDPKRTICTVAAPTILELPEEEEEELEPELIGEEGEELEEGEEPSAEAEEGAEAEAEDEEE
ncbi:MAG: 50S ribosomal protein L25/general stress protein Ctc [Gemmatimonadetes bacterium]|nr:50S ribosomal protein L25/general stress protein Ctc [Gemmatimonadota bacterium]NIQ56416.1 50S ribosomal protein L25/general stress protein Ctc [Gemmatimonadota bacterium]NIU76605.1 50S ribosomal protein L25/general stress protein Ctc [Gammaproteobacteria bacterium]NIX46052.1 50S ribosomal protein L25/general stress protein Ctc [Gemmatimonadota bacterium]NIY10373.1 50S ribosomal protein L25/general stress protein Ctc [Gemmatimonadota bacterium]